MTDTLTATMPFPGLHPWLLSCESSAESQALSLPHRGWKQSVQIPGISSYLGEEGKYRQRDGAEKTENVLRLCDGQPRQPQSNVTQEVTLGKCLILATPLFLSYLKDTVMMHLFPEANLK